MDNPAGLKKHSAPVPLTGGFAVGAGFAFALILIRFLTSFPTGTLRTLRGLFLGGAVIFILGLIDDIKKPGGLPVWVKLLGQVLAACALIAYGVKIEVFGPVWGGVITVLWVVGITNAFNLLDIRDGLSGGTGLVCGFFFFIVTLPSEQLYVNFAACALFGALLGFLPYNMSDKKKIFLGDSGSMFLGFIMAALAMGGQYSGKNPAGWGAPLLILAVPLFDTAFVSLARILKKKNPLRASNDHIAMRLEKMGLSSKASVNLIVFASIIYGVLALLAVNLGPKWALFIYFIVLADMALGVYLLLKTEIE